MRKWIFLIVLFTSTAQVFGQSILLLDSVTKEPIQYAHIIYYADKKVAGGTYSDKLGKAELLLSGEVDTVKISYLGYETQIITANKIPERIFLVAKPEMLNEVLITPNYQAPTAFVGFKKGRKSGPHTSPITGYQLVTFIKNPSSEAKQIKSFVFYLKEKNTSASAMIRLILFKNENGIPGAEIAVKNLPSVGSFENQKVEINLDSLNLIFPVSGLFVGVELIGCANEIEPKDKNSPCQWVTMHTLQKGRTLNQTFVRAVFSTSSWTDLNEGMQIDATVIPAFGLIVYE